MTRWIRGRPAAIVAVTAILLIGSTGMAVAADTAVIDEAAAKAQCETSYPG